MRKIYAGVDVGGTNVKIVACDYEQNIVVQKSVPTSVPISPLSLAQKIAAELLAFTEDNNMELTGVCVALPGQIDMHGNIPLKVNALGWNSGDMDIAGHLNSLIKAPVLLINDGSAHLYGEYKCGSARGMENVIMISLGTGVGGAILVNGKILEGASGLAGELGHMVIEADGAECNCGNKGCFQAYCSSRGIVNYARMQLKTGVSTVLWPLSENNPEKIDPAMLAKGAEMKDRFCLELWERTARYLGYALLTLINIFNPELILISGGISNAQDYYLPQACEYVKEHLIHKKQQCRIRKAELGEYAGAFGAGYWIWKSIKENMEE